MDIHLDQITQDEPFRWHETRAVPAEALERTQLLDLGEISLKGEIERSAGGLLLSGELEYSQTLECPRCLGRLTEDVATDINLNIRSKSSEPTLGELELDEAELDELFLEGEVLDTSALIVEQIQLNIPMRKLCNESCRGLCSQCGTNLNANPCECEKQATDPRWSALEALRARIEN